MVELDYYTAIWCGPCRNMKPILAELEASGIKITRIDVDQNKTLAIQKRIMGVPTFIIKKDGVDIVRLVGMKSKQTLLQQIEAAKKA